MVGLNVKLRLVLLAYIEDHDGPLGPSAVGMNVYNQQIFWLWKAGDSFPPLPRRCLGMPRYWSKMELKMFEPSLGSFFPPRMSQFGGSSATPNFAPWRGSVANSIGVAVWNCMNIRFNKPKSGARTPATAGFRCLLPGFSFLKGAVWSGKAWDGQPVRSKNCPLDQHFIRFYKQKIWHTLW